MSDFRYTEYDVVVRPLSEEDGGGFVALVPDLKGCMSDGATQREALDNVKDAIIEWCNAQNEAGREMPQPGAYRDFARQQAEQLYDLIEDQERKIKMLKVKVRQLEERSSRFSIYDDAVSLHSGSDDDPFVPDWTISH